MARTKKSAPGKRKAEAARPEKKSKKQRKERQEAQPQQEKPQQPAPAEKKKKAKSHAAEEALLAKLLGGMSVATFLATHFEKKPLHVRNNGSHQLFDKKLFSRKRLLKNVLGSHELGFGRDLTVCRYVDGERENYDGSEGSGIAASGLVGSLFDRGYSCQFYQPQRYVDGLCALNSAFETVFGGLAGASAYLTPPNSQALAPHHDDVEVFILQTEGRKKWKLYHPLVELPGEHSSDLSPDDIGEPSMELTLEEGDVLYFPRGVVHQACTDEKEFSTHVTISVYQHNSWANFLEVAMPRVIRDAFDMDIDFRRGLPVGYLNYVGTQFPTDSDQVKSFEKSVKRLVHKLVTHVTTRTLQEAADEAAMDVVANRLPPLPTKDVVSTADVLDDNALIRFKHRSHIRLCLGTNEEDQEPYVAVYYSTQNCRLHHMGLCTCNKDASDDEEDESEDGEANAEELADERSDKDEAESGDNSENEDDDEDGIGMDAEGGPMPPQPRSLVFPGELAPALMKLYGASNGAGAKIEELVEEDMDETAVRGMLLRLMAEELLIASSQS